MALKKMLVFLVVLTLTGCPLEVKMVIYNFTGADVSIVSKDKSLSIRNAEHKKIDEDEFDFDRNPYGYEQIKLSDGRCYIIAFSSAIAGPKDLFSDGEYKANLVLAKGDAYFVPPSVDVSVHSDLTRFQKLPLCHR